MKLRPLAMGLDRLVINMLSSSVRLGLEHVFDPLRTHAIDMAIVVCDGTPEDRVLIVLAHHTDGVKTVGVSKPRELRGLEALRAIKAYVHGIKGLRKMLFLTDRDTRRSDQLPQEVLKRLEGLHVKSLHSGEQGRLIKTSVAVDDRELELLVLFNDLDREDLARHTIEEHLLTAAEEVLGIDIVREHIRRVKGDPKLAWSGLGKETQLRVMTELRERRDLVEEVFPQHLLALRELDA